MYDSELASIFFNFYKIVEVRQKFVQHSPEAFVCEILEFSPPAVTLNCALINGLKKSLLHICTAGPDLVLLFRETKRAKLASHALKRSLRLHHRHIIVIGSFNCLQCVGDPSNKNKTFFVFLLSHQVRINYQTLSFWEILHLQLTSSRS